MRSTSLILVFILFSRNTPARTANEWSLNLDTSLQFQSFLAPSGEDTNHNLWYFELTPVYRWKNPQSLRLFLKPSLSLSPDNTSDEEKVFFDMTEAYARFQTSSLQWQFGNTLHTWGITDGYNPLDVINPRQYFDPLRSRKLGVTSLILSQGGDDWDYEVLYIPQNQEAILPGSKSRWLPQEVYLPETPNNDLVLLLPKNLNYGYSSRQNLDEARKNNFAFRFQKRSSWMDLALSFYEGVAGFPLVKPEVSGTVLQIAPKTVIAVDPEVTLHTTSYRIRHTGLALSTQQQGYLLKYATSYSQSFGENPLLPGWTHENVLGVERSFNLSTHGVLIAVLQHSFINSQRRSDSNLSMIEIFRSGWMLGGRLQWKEVWSFSLMSLYDSIHQSHSESLSVSRRLYDTWILNLSADLIQGPPESPLGVYEKNDSLGLSISRFF